MPLSILDALTSGLPGFTWPKSVALALPLLMTPVFVDRAEAVPIRFGVASIFDTRGSGNATIRFLDGTTIIDPFAIVELDVGDGIQVDIAANSLVDIEYDFPGVTRSDSDSARSQVLLLSLNDNYRVSYELDFFSEVRGFVDVDGGTSRPNGSFAASSDLLLNDRSVFLPETLDILQGQTGNGRRSDIDTIEEIRTYPRFPRQDFFLDASVATSAYGDAPTFRDDVLASSNARLSYEIRVTAIEPIPLPAGLLLLPTALLMLAIGRRKRRIAL
ncbi:hypothetical protein [Yoonia sediminilitoris]|uniref:Uncharacterized protein n=1 Tax=Yoonia sediminilitoris TaxID=1286148 RepID=A0A2T6KR73_9RHOB|nr:hypothetical protein [Yoonia sediminilitoris]PUB19056.1 hypothetical protein C8N45_101647 [Yoonia sediminilitoris]RCW99224.1 hypothetical protein DFP92_101647 [Yoonia sediminilitoris]